ncbi:MAG TPA: VCBS repeat-containing protein, partial [Pyrinomonadaceae bacterium]|nr:VCBS repeat-containing protein [Pyrinomonadaceae bacterium]
MRKVFAQIVGGELSPAGGRFPALQEQRNHQKVFSIPRRRRVLLAAFILMGTVGGLMAVNVSYSRKSAPSARAESSRSGVTVHAAGRGTPYLNLQDGREMSVAYRGDRGVINALQNGAAHPRALASADFDGNATPDVVAGYAFNGVGIITLQRGNPDAYAPPDQSVYERMESGYNPDALLPTVETFEVPQPADFVQIGDFNSDGRKDILVGGRHGVLLLLKGDESGGLLPAEEVQLPGQLTCLTAGEFRAADGKLDVAVGINGPGGPQLLIYDGVAGGLTGTPMEFLLPSEPSVIRFDTMDADSFVDAVVAAGSEILLVHGWGRKQTPVLESRLERVGAGSEIRGLSTGHFIWDREGRREIAVLTEDGSLQLIQAKGLNTTKFTDAELVTRNRERFRPQVTQQAREQDVEAAPEWNSRGKSGWAATRSVATNAVATGLSSLATTNMNSSETDEVVVTASKSELKIVRQTNGNKVSESTALTLSGDMAQLSLESAAPAVAALQLPAKLNGERNMLVLQEGATALTVVPLAPATITVDRFDDPDAGAPLQAVDNCTAVASDCSLRGAIEFANLALAADQPTTINLPAGTYTLDNNGTSVAGCDNNPVGDLTINGSIAMVGLAGGAIIRQLATGVSNDGDRVMCLNLAFAINKTYSFSNLTIIGGRDGSSPAAANVLGGGGIIGGELDNLTTLTNVTLANNSVHGALMGTNNNGGGG